MNIINNYSNSEKDNNKLRFGTILKFVLDKNNISIEELANVLGYKKTIILQWLNGKREPYESEIVHVAEHLELSTDFLLGRTDETGKICPPAYSLVISNPEAAEKSLIMNFNNMPVKVQKIFLKISKTFVEATKEQNNQISHISDNEKTLLTNFHDMDISRRITFFRLSKTFVESSRYIHK